MDQLTYIYKQFNDDVSGYRQWTKSICGNLDSQQILYTLLYRIIIVKKLEATFLLCLLHPSYGQVLLFVYFEERRIFGDNKWLFSFACMIVISIEIIKYAIPPIEIRTLKKPHYEPDVIVHIIDMISRWIISIVSKCQSDLAHVWLHRWMPDLNVIERGLIVGGVILI